MNLLEIKKSKSPLNKIELNESIDHDALSQLLNSDLLLKDSWSQNGITYENERQQLLAYNALYHNGNNAKVTYKLTSCGYGRVYANKSLSLGSLRKEVRHTLAKDIYVDIDIENCHPMILCQVCSKSGIECESLTEYTTNRDEILKNVMDTYSVDRDQAKRLFLSLQYGGKFENWAKEHATNVKPSKFISKFASELDLIAEIISEKNPKLSKVTKDKMETNNKHNFKGALLSSVRSMKD